MVKFVSISPPRGFHFMKKKGGTYALMKGNYKPHKGAVKKAKFVDKTYQWTKPKR